MYVARITGRTGQKVNLVWHSGNVYGPDDVPASPKFMRGARECISALEYAILNAVPQSNVSFVELPHDAMTETGFILGWNNSVASKATR